MRLTRFLIAPCLCTSTILALTQDLFSDSVPEPRTLVLSSLAADKFTTLSHPAFPGRSARIKKSDFCDGRVASYTGYIDAVPKHFFFYFFENRNDPNKDDVLLWTNGGPGGSSATGIFIELGPCLIASPNSTKYNPYSWNSNANVFFIDQPIGTGFLYHDLGDVILTTEGGGQDIAAFVATFFETLDKFKSRYLPIYGAAIYDQNSFLVAKSIEPIFPGGSVDFGMSTYLFAKLSAPFNISVISPESCLADEIMRYKHTLRESAGDLCGNSYEGFESAAGTNTAYFPEDSTLSTYDRLGTAGKAIHTIPRLQHSAPNCAGNLTVDITDDALPPFSSARGG